MMASHAQVTHFSVLFRFLQAQDRGTAKRTANTYVFLELIIAEEQGGGQVHDVHQLPLLTTEIFISRISVAHLLFFPLDQGECELIPNRGYAVIDQADRELQEWVKSIVTGVEVVLGPPRQLDGKYGVSLYLLALATPPPAWMNRQPATRVALRYLVTAWAEDDEQAHSLLGKLVLAVMEKREYELDLAELPATMWTALSIAPRPAFTLCVPLYVERPEPVTRLVHGPLVVRGAPVINLHGIVLGPGDIPIVGASVELPALQLSEHTDARGRFYFSTVPGEPRGIQLLVKAKGRVQSVTVEQPTSDREPLAVRFDSFER